MPYEEPVQVTVSLDIPIVDRAGFGTPIFASSHNYFTERVRTYSSITEVGEDFPTTAPAYIAAQGGFGQSPKPRTIKIARRDTDLITLTPEAVTASGQIYAVTVVGTDDVPITATFTTVTGSEVSTDIVTDLIADLAAIVGVTVGGTTTLTLAKAGLTPFSINTETRMTPTYTVTETPADLVTAINQVDTDWFFFTADDHTDAFINAMDNVIQSLEKLYVPVTSDAGSLAVTTEPPTDTGGKLIDEGNTQTAGWWHDEADTVFPDLAYVTIGSTKEAGQVVWSNQQVIGVGGPARDASTGFLLSTAQKTNLVDKRMSFVESRGGANYSNAQGGATAGGKSMSLIRDAFFIGARLSESLNALITTKDKIPYTQPGIDSIEGNCRSELNKYVESGQAVNVLREDNPFVINFPKARDIDATTKATNIFTGSIDAFLSGNIGVIRINVSLSL